MRLLRFRDDSTDAWTYCSFAGAGEADAQTLLASRLLDQYEVQVSDDETEEWTSLGDPEE